MENQTSELIAEYQGNSRLKVSTMLVATVLGIAYFGCLVVFALELKPQHPTLIIGTLIIGLFIAIPAISFVYTHIFTQILLYQDGLELRRGNLRYHVPWDMLQAFGKKVIDYNISDRQGQTIKEIWYGIQLKTSVPPSSSNIWQELSLSSAMPIDFLRLNWGFIEIPLKAKTRLQADEIDKTAFAETDFGENLLHFVPHLFE